MKKLNIALFCCLFFLVSTSWARVLPEHGLLAPSTVSPQLKKAIDAGLPDWWNTHPKTEKEWQAFQRSRDTEALKKISGLLKAFGVRSGKGEMAGVPVFTLEPDNLPAKNKNRVLLHLHGGGYVLNAGESGTGEGIFMAGIGHFRVVSVDYRMAPEFPYPAALDDALKVYRGLLNSYKPENIGIFGTSTGGGLTLAVVLKAKQDGLPLPGAIAVGTPWTDFTPTGDSYFTNENVDNVLVSYTGWLKDAANAYANGHDLKDPLLSPVYGDVNGFPPTFLGTGTRDLFLSNTIRMHNKLLAARVPANLLVLEGISHAQYLQLGPDAPETLFFFEQMSEFFDKYLGSAKNQ